MIDVARFADANGLLVAFVFVGLVMLVSAFVARHVGRGRVHASAIAIALGLVLAWVAGAETGGKNGVADYPLLAGQSLPYMLKEIKLVLDKRRRVELIKHDMLELASRPQIEDAIHFFAGQHVTPDQVSNSLTTPGKRTKRNRFRTEVPADAAQ